MRARDRVGNVSQWVSAEPIKVQTETKYYLFGGRRVAMSLGSSPIAQERTVYYFHTNHLGSVVLTTDAAGAAVSQTRYLPFGEEHWSSGGSLSDFTYTGQRNNDFGLMDYNARFYSSRLGRFASADSIIPNPGNPIAWDRYAGMGNNPIRFKDPSGHAQACADGDIGGGCGSAGIYIPKPPTPTSTYRPFTTNTPRPSSTPTLLIPYVPENQRTYVPRMLPGPTRTPTSTGTPTPLPPGEIAQQMGDDVADMLSPFRFDPGYATGTDVSSMILTNAQNISASSPQLFWWVAPVAEVVVLIGTAFGAAWDIAPAVQNWWDNSKEGASQIATMLATNGPTAPATSTSTATSTPTPIPSTTPTPTFPPPHW